jgi:hypothetical protein
LTEKVRLMLDTDNPSVGRFDKSFLVHMIKDFFLVLLAASVLEFALKARRPGSHQRHVLCGQ